MLIRLNKDGLKLHKCYTKTVINTLFSYKINSQRDKYTVFSKQSKNPWKLNVFKGFRCFGDLNKNR